MTLSPKISGHLPKNKSKQIKYDGANISYENYARWEKPYWGEYKYEWNNGVLEARIKMKKEEHYIWDNILFAFEQTKYRQRRDVLTSEARCKFEKLQVERIPDICYFTKGQIDAMRKGENVVPEFLVEIISTHDTTYQLESKIEEYLIAGVKCIWLIFPNLKKVRVMTSSKNIADYIHDEKFSAAPTMPELLMSADMIFAE
jgi:Uma2 family endonuclease